MVFANAGDHIINADDGSDLLSRSWKAPMTVQICCSVIVTLRLLNDRARASNIRFELSEPQLRFTGPFCTH